MSESQLNAVMEVLRGLHGRDVGFGHFRHLRKGPGLGLWRSIRRALRDGGPLPDMRQLPDSMFFAARTAQLLAERASELGELQRWVNRNERALGAAHVVPVDPVDVLGCVTFEDVRNRIVVGLEDLHPDVLVLPCDQTL